MTPRRFPPLFLVLTPRLDRVVATLSPYDLAEIAILGKDRGGDMADNPIPTLIVRANVDGSFAVVDTAQGARMLRENFATEAAARRFIDEYLLERFLIEPIGRNADC